jgi:hypothetical protein
MSSPSSSAWGFRFNIDQVGINFDMGVPHHTVHESYDDMPALISRSMFFAEEQLVVRISGSYIATNIL